MGMFRSLRRGVTLLTLGAAGGAAYVTARHYLETPQPLESALPGEGLIDRKHGGDIYYDLAGPQDATPMVLLHDFYPGASAFEFRRVYPQLARTYRVYAPDWLGFGMSERPALAYTGEFYASTLRGFLRDVVARPAIVLAHGRAANVAVRAASDTPELFDRLILVGPYTQAGLTAEPTALQTALDGVQALSLGAVPYALLSTRLALRWGANSRRVEPVSDDELDHLYASAHQYGGQHALLALLTGELDLPIQHTLALLEPPALLVAGEADARLPRADLEDLASLRQGMQIRVIPDAGDALLEEQPEVFLREATPWLGARLERQPASATLLAERGAVATASSASQASQASHTSHASSVAQSASGGRAASAVSERDASAGSQTPGATETALNTQSDELVDDVIPDLAESVTPGMSDMGFEGPQTVVEGIENLTTPLDAEELGADDRAMADAQMPELGDTNAQDVETREDRIAAQAPNGLGTGESAQRPEVYHPTTNGEGAARAEQPAEPAPADDAVATADAVQTDASVATAGAVQTDDAVATPAQAVATPMEAEAPVERATAPAEPDAQPEPIAPAARDALPPALQDEGEAPASASEAQEEDEDLRPTTPMPALPRKPRQSQPAAPNGRGGAGSASGGAGHGAAAESTARVAPRKRNPTRPRSAQNTSGNKSGQGQSSRSSSGGGRRPSRGS